MIKRQRKLLGGGGVSHRMPFQLMFFKKSIQSSASFSPTSDPPVASLYSITTHETTVSVTDLPIGFKEAEL